MDLYEIRTEREVISRVLPVDPKEGSGIVLMRRCIPISRWMTWISGAKVKKTRKVLFWFGLKNPERLKEELFVAVHLTRLVIAGLVALARLLYGHYFNASLYFSWKISKVYILTKIVLEVIFFLILFAVNQGGTFSTVQRNLQRLLCDYFTGSLGISSVFFCHNFRNISRDGWRNLFTIIFMKSHYFLSFSQVFLQIFYH